MQTESVACSHCGKVFSIKFAVRPKGTSCPNCKKRLQLIVSQGKPTCEQGVQTPTPVAHQRIGGMSEPTEYDRSTKRRSRRIGFALAGVGIYLILWFLSSLHGETFQNVVGPIGWQVRTVAPFTYLATMIVEPNLQAGYTALSWSPNDSGKRFYFAYDGRGDLFSYGGDLSIADTSAARRKTLLFRPGMFLTQKEAFAKAATVRRKSRSNFMRDAVANQAIVWILVCNPRYSSLTRFVWIAEEKPDGIVQAMQEVQGFGFDTAKMRIWKDREVLLSAVKDDTLKQWLTARGK